MSFDARQMALTVLTTLDKTSRTLDAVLEDLSGAHAMADRRERGLFNALVFGVLRWRGYLDAILAHFSNTPLHRIDPAVMNILRLGLFQVIYLDRIPTSAAVNTAVQITKALAPAWVAGFANALLRRAASEYSEVLLPDSNKDPARFLAVAKSFPRWLAERWLQRYGFRQTVSLCDAVNSIPPITVRTNTIKTTSGELLQSLGQWAAQAAPTAYAPDAISFINPKRPLSEMPPFKQGWFQVQDEAAQLIALHLAPSPGEAVLDACAGRGGKTGHLAQLMKNRGTVTALDKNAGRLLQLQSEMKRLGVAIVSTRCVDLDQPTPAINLPAFDRILVDAPCSGLGVMRRNPDIKWAPSKKNLARYGQRQLRLLANLAPLVKPGGVLVYAVCSPEPEENEDVIDVFLKKHSDFVIDNNFGKMPSKIVSTMAAGGCLKTYPLLASLDGFFSARLKRIK